MSEASGFLKAAEFRQAYQRRPRDVLSREMITRKEDLWGLLKDEV